MSSPPAEDAIVSFAPVYVEGDPGRGIGGYNLINPVNRVFTFDYDHSGKLDHLVLYRPGTGTIWILRNKNGEFTPVYQEGEPGRGIGGYNLLNPGDRVFAFDYDHSGKLDHLVLYRPGTGTIWILHNKKGVFTPVYQEGEPGQGIGGYNLLNPTDRIFAYDYDHSGKLDHLVLYRPGTGTIWILCHRDGKFSPVYQEGEPGNGIGGYKLRNPLDRVFAFDYDGSCMMDHLVLYCPGTGTIWILRNKGGNFSPVYQEGEPGRGIGRYDLLSIAYRAFPLDLQGNRKQNHLVLYRPGTGIVWILRHYKGTFSPVYQGGGIGGYNLNSLADCAFAFDYKSKGTDNYPTFYRPSTGTIWILKKNK